MSMAILPKEIRLQIWAIAYLTDLPRLVAIETHAHDQNHDETVFCPRYSPSPAPTIVNVCQEARAEAHYQAVKAGHLVRLHEADSNAFYFRCDKDILYMDLEGTRVQHFDDSPENGLLAHFKKAVGCDPLSLRTVAVTKVILHGFRDGSFSNVLREFPNISRMVMIISDDVLVHDDQKEIFVRAAARIVRMYKLDLMNRARQEGITFKTRHFDVDFARCEQGKLVVIPRDVWVEWSDGGDDWATLDATVDPFW